MKKLLFFLLAQVLVSGIIAQTGKGTVKQINLTQKHAAGDVQVITTGKYIMHFRSADLVAAIREVGKVSTRDYSALTSSLKEGKIKSLLFNDDTSTNRQFSNLFQQQLGCYLISRGKVTITKDKKPLKVVTAHEAPELQTNDGTKSGRVNFFYTDGKALIFAGEISTKLRPAK